MAEVMNRRLLSARIDISIVRTARIIASGRHPLIDADQLGKDPHSAERPIQSGAQ
jgi:hypothetical protein